MIFRKFFTSKKILRIEIFQKFVSRFTVGPRLCRTRWCRGHVTPQKFARDAEIASKICARTTSHLFMILIGSKKKLPTIIFNIHKWEIYL